MGVEPHPEERERRTALHGAVPAADPRPKPPTPQLVQRLRAQQEAHRQRSKIVRVLFAVVGFTLLLGGAAMLVLPGPALAVIPIALAILALEFQWADNLLERSLQEADKAKRKAQETSTLQRVLSGVAVALGVAAVVTWAVLGDIPVVPV